jgi:hypothetical protein
MVQCSIKQAQRKLNNNNNNNNNNIIIIIACHSALQPWVRLGLLLLKGVIYNLICIENRRIWINIFFMNNKTRFFINCSNYWEWKLQPLQSSMLYVTYSIFTQRFASNNHQIQRRDFIKRTYLRLTVVLYRVMGPSVTAATLPTLSSKLPWLKCLHLSDARKSGDQLLRIKL